MLLFTAPIDDPALFLDVMLHDSCSDTVSFLVNGGTVDGIHGGMRDSERHDGVPCSLHLHKVGPSTTKSPPRRLPTHRFVLAMDTLEEVSCSLRSCLF